jgi:hypothetical protein
MQRAALIVPVALALTLRAAPARAEWFYVDAQVGGEYFDLDALQGGEVFDQALEEATASLAAEGSPEISTPEASHYSSAGSFVWGVSAGVSLGRWIRLGARFTHSFMEIRPEPPSPEADVSFDLQLVTILGEFQLRIPIRFVVPYVGIGVGYAYLASDTTVVQGDASATSELGTKCLDVLGTVGLDFNIGDHFALGFVANFSFIGFYSVSADALADSNVAWGFVNDYMAVITVRI